MNCNWDSLMGHFADMGSIAVYLRKRLIRLDEEPQYELGYATL